MFGTEQDSLRLEENAKSDKLFQPQGISGQFAEPSEVFYNYLACS